MRVPLNLQGVLYIRTTRISIRPLFFSHQREVTLARHAIGRVSAARARDSARSGVAQAAAEANDEDYHRASSRFEPDGAARAAGSRR